MRCSIVSAVLVALLVVAAGARGQSFDVAIREYPAVGKSVVITNSGTTNITFIVSSDGMVLKEDKKVEVEEKQFTQRVLVPGKQRPLKYANSYTKASKGLQGAPKQLSYAGKTLIIERKGDKYVVTPEEGEVERKDLEELTKQVNKPLASEVFLPKKPVAVGDTWPVDTKTAVAVLGGTGDDGLDLAKFKGQGKLTKAYKKGQEQRGTLEFTISVPVNKLGPLTLAKPIELRAKLVLDAAIDGSSTAYEATGTMSLKGKSEVVQNNMTFTLDVAIDGVFRNIQTAEK